MLAHFKEQFASIGVQLGARYDGSPIISADGPAPADNLVRYTPTSIPGGRAPHVWLDAQRTYGSSLYDQLGEGFTLLRLGPHAPDVWEMIEAATKCKIPFKVVNIPDADARDLYGCDLAIVRPDQYIAWRGNQPMSDPQRQFSIFIGSAGAAAT